LSEFVLIVEFQVKPDCLEQFNRAIAINAKASVADEPGCRQFDVLHNQDDPSHVVLYEVYDSEAAFRDDHMKRSHTQAFLAQAKALVTKQTAYKLKRTVAPPVKR
jgi:(4S)-4-hydroxy-5-phosphonooxypentane-2,3-dione isomerase